MQTHRLDTSKTPMLAAVDWFLREAGDGGAGQQSLDLSGTLVATPGARAGRVLITLLAQACQERGLVLTPPATTTAGRLPETLAPTTRAAGALHRRLAWRLVLQSAPEDAKRAVLPGSAQAEAWAVEIERTADELARAGLRYADAARAELPPLEEPERWHALAGLQERYEALLAGADLVDPMLHAIDAAGSPGEGLQAVVLLGCMDLSELSRRMVRALPCPVHALVMLDEGLGTDGVVDEAFWHEADVDVDPRDVFVTGDTAEQSALAVRAAVDMGSGAIGTADESLAGAVRRAADGHGLSVHVAWGGEASAAGPARLLGDIAVLLRERRFTDLARVLACPMVVASLARAEHRFAQLPRALDDYLADALPTRAFGALPEGGGRAETPRKIVWHGRKALTRLLGPLRSDPRPLREWAGAIEHTLAGLLGPAQDQLGPASLEAIAAIGEQLRVLSSLPGALDPAPAPAHEAISLVLSQLEQRGAAGEPGGEDLDLLGWLELPLDPSDAMVLMGAHHSTLPVATAPSPLVTEGLRRALGLPGEGRKVARDAANLASLLGGGRRVRFVLGSVDAQGEPLLPSTLLLRGPGDAPARVLARVNAAFRTLPAAEAPPACGYRVGVMREAEPVASMSVTSFRAFLESPYQFYLRYVLRLREVSPAPAVPRLEANTFGTLLHEALRLFGGDVEARGVTDESQIRQLMHARLWEATERLTGRARSATTMAQIDAAERRLAAMARVEAERRLAGWQTVEVEWTPQTPPALAQTGVTLRGAIDRVDLNKREGALALFDYKTSETPSKPRVAHRRRDGRWRDLQLPLYEILARPIALAYDVEQIPTLGYIALAGHDAAVLEAGWTEEELAEAHACAVDVATRVRSGLEAMAEVGSPRYDGPHARLAGVGMLLDDEHTQREGGEP